MNLRQNKRVVLSTAQACLLKFLRRAYNYNKPYTAIWVNRRLRRYDNSIHRTYWGRKRTTLIRLRRRLHGKW